MMATRASALPSNRCIAITGIVEKCRAREEIITQVLRVSIRNDLELKTRAWRRVWCNSDGHAIAALLIVFSSAAEAPMATAPLISAARII